MLERIGPMAYRLALPHSLVGVHDIFYVSLLRKYLANADTVMNTCQPEIQPNLSYVKHPVKVLDWKEKS